MQNWYCHCMRSFMMYYIVYSRWPFQYFVEYVQGNAVVNQISLKQYWIIFSGEMAPKSYNLYSTYWNHWVLESSSRYQRRRVRDVTQMNIRLLMLRGLSCCWRRWGGDWTCWRLSFHSVELSSTVCGPCNQEYIHSKFLIL